MCKRNKFSRLEREGERTQTRKKSASCAKAAAVAAPAKNEAKNSVEPKMMFENDVLSYDG